MSRYFNDLDLDIDLNETFGEWVDLDQTRIDCAGETTELGDKTDVTLTNGLVWVGADETTWDRTAETDATTESIDCELLAQNSL